MLILQAAREVTAQEGFNDLLESVRNRIDDIESLHRTRELTVSSVVLRCTAAPTLVLIHVCFDLQFKDVSSGDRIRLVVDKGGALLVDE